MFQEKMILQIFCEIIINIINNAAGYHEKQKEGLCKG
jgi:hypothetical protein